MRHLAALVVAAVACLVTTPRAASADESPDIILIVADDLRANAIGALGGSVRTPHLDRLYRAGFRFDNTYAMGSNSAAVCSPSRAMMLSGYELGRVWETHTIDEDTPTLPSILRGAGYATFGTGKWHGVGRGGSAGRAFAKSFSHGDEVLLGGCIACSSTSHTANRAAMDASYDTPLRRLEEDGSFTTHQRPTHVSERFAQAALRFMTSSDIERPRFVYVSFTAPHDPRVSPAPFDTMYRDDAGRPTVELPPNFAAQPPLERAAYHGGIRDEVLLDTIGGHTEANVRAELADYYGMTSHMDAQIGLIIDAALHAEGLDPASHTPADLKQTLIVFTSDHGLAIGSHGLLGKQNPFEHSIKAAPLVFAGAVDGRAIEAGATAAFAYLSDVTPTILEFASVPPPPDQTGRVAWASSLAGVVRGEHESVRDAIYFAYQHRTRAIRRGDWKLIDYPGLGRVQLFDLNADPSELEDLASRPEHAARLDALRTELDRLGEKLNAPGHHP